jgi:hypothetical protein
VGPREWEVALTEVLDVVVATREGAHRVVTLAYERAQNLIADGKRVRIVTEEAEDTRSLQQNAFYWAVVLKEIAEQASIDGQRWSAEAWHEYGKRTFLGYEFKRTVIAGRKRKAVSKQLRSTTKLSVKRMSEYLEKLMAFAVTDLGVRFSETRWEDWRGQ